MGEISGLFFLMKKPKSRKNVSIEHTVRGSGDRCFASVRGAQSSAALGEPSAQSMLRIGARSAIAANFDPENETALPFVRGG
ncbi:UNVERIFIED_CONTAM: hypothetical protein BEN50_05630 [Euhalothece sp. KZN 001]